MDRLLGGRPLHSDGKLTIKSLAAEAQLKRWTLPGGLSGATTADRSICVFALFGATAHVP